MTIGSVLIANRGEIAVRIIAAAKALGIRTVQAHSAADADMLAVRVADAAVCIGPAAASKSYLDIKAVVAAAVALPASTPFIPATAFSPKMPPSPMPWRRRG